MPTPSDLPAVFWVGGGSGAGKTTVSRAVAYRGDLAWYRVDAHAYEHRDRLVDRRVITKDTRTDDERWLIPTARQLADEFVTMSALLFPLIIDDLRALGTDVGVIVEGPQLLPDLVAVHGADGDSAVWLLPTGDRGEEGPVDWAPDHGAGPAQAHDQREAYARLVQGLRALPNRQREAFTLRVLEELDVADTARAMGCSEGSVKTHLSRARDALQKQLEEFR